MVIKHFFIPFYIKNIPNKSFLTFNQLNYFHQIYMCVCVEREREREREREVVLKHFSNTWQYPPKQPFGMVSWF